MAETTRSTSGSSTQNTSSSSSPGGARNPSNSSSTTTNPSSTAGSSTSGSSSSISSSSTAGSGTSTGSSGASARPTSQQSPSGQRSPAGPQREPNQGSQSQGSRQAERGERRGEEHHVELTGDTMSDAKKVGSELIGAARDSAVSLIDAQRARAAEQITAVGDALRRSMESFEESGSSALVQYANQAADQICGFADAVRERSWGDLAGDLESFARRSPTLFMISAVGLGFLAGRFLMSSSDRTRADGGGGSGRSGARAGETRRDVAAVHRTAPAAARAEYGGGVRE